MGIKDIARGVVEGLRFGAKPRAESFSSLSILLSMGNEAQDIEVIDNAAKSVIKGIMEAQSL